MDRTPVQVKAARAESRVEVLESVSVPPATTVREVARSVLLDVIAEHESEAETIGVWGRFVT